MGRKEIRALERKVRHLQNTKPWELQMLIKEQYDRALVESRSNRDVIAPGDKVTLDVVAMMDDPDWLNYRQDYKDFVIGHANEVFTVSDEMESKGAYELASLEEDESDPKRLFYVGHLKKVKGDG